MKRWTWWKAAAAIALCVLAVIALYRLFFTRQGVHITHMSMQQLSSYLQSFGAAGNVIGALLVYVQTAVPFVPFVVVAGVNVILYPSPWGFVVNYVMACLGAVSAFLFARYFGHDKVMRRLNQSPQAMQFNKQMEKNGFLYVLVGRLIPVIPSSLVNLGAGVTKVSFRAFLFGTLLGKLPMVFLESQITNYLLHFKRYRVQLLILLLVFALLMAAGNVFRKRLSGRKEP
ncbi:membrane protein [Gordoniibacillus kamchatkensis]|uniref:TVP38/TMEM64 family membrane protein n=1 Tax=Gordoniibacillus kamchatkensis TaxID=1590651 RepID=A0ABR5AK66_9BACL|nr:TVP38/TMEM64 family protein [Paenibacillus sp. VKM B-2647]KIL41163.1 membrane protein [Paenibacillus sp. VKM B-2647]